MSDYHYSDLIEEFGSGTGDKKTVVTPHADLINEFGSGKSETKYVAPPNVPTPDMTPAANQPEGSRTQQLPGDLWAGIKNLPAEYSKDIKDASDKFYGGINEFSERKPFSAVADTTMGAIQGVGATLGINTSMRKSTESLNNILPTDKTVNQTTAFGNPMFDKPSNIAGTGDKAVQFLPFALPVAKMGASIIKNSMPTNRALDKIVNLIGPENLPQALQTLEENPRLSIMDVSQGVKSAGQGLAVTPGPHQTTLRNFAEGRSQTAKGAVEDIYNDTMGVPVNVKTKLDTLKSNIKDIGKNEINPVVAAAKPVDISPVIDNINNILKPGVNSVISEGQPLPNIGLKKELQNLRPLLSDGKSVRTNAEDLHKIQSNLRAQAEGMMDSANGQDRLIGRGLMDVRNQIVTAIDTATGGAYKPALSKYRDANQIDEAFNKGFSITQNRKGQWSDRPEFWQDWVSNASPEELQAAREGARIAADQQINGMRFGAKKGTDIPEVQFNRDKLGLLFPKEEVDQMAKGLQHEKLIAESNSDLFKGSQTSARQQGAKAIEPRPDYKPNLTSLMAPIAEIGVEALTHGELPVVGAASVLGYQGLRKGMTKAGQKLDRATNNKIVDFITAQGQARDDLMNALAQRVPQAKPSMAQRLQNYALPVLPP